MALTELDRGVQTNRLHHDGFQRMILSDTMLRLSTEEKVAVCHMSSVRQDNLVRPSNSTASSYLYLVTGKTDTKELLESKASRGLGMLQRRSVKQDQGVFHKREAMLAVVKVKLRRFIMAFPSMFL